MDEDEPGAGRERAAARKRALRAGARAARSAADPAGRDSLGSAWADGVTDLVDATGARTVALYVSYGTEPPTAPLVEALVARGVRVLVPILLEDRDLDWAEHVAPGAALGREAVAAADLVVVPALVVGSDGSRLGQGGGSYDRALRRLRSGTPVVALVHDGELVDAGVVPAEPHDVAVTHVVTPTRTVVLTEVVAEALLPVDPELGDPDARLDLDVALAVAAGGAIGAVLRWSLNEALPRSGGGFPWATFLENVSGAFVLGALAVVLMQRWPEHRYARPFLAVGVLGGFTTFSTYVADIHGLTDDGHASVALLYLVLTLVVGLTASVVGIVVGRALAPGRRA